MTNETTKHLVSHVWVVLEWQPDGWIHGIHDNRKYAHKQRQELYQRQYVSYTKGERSDAPNKFDVLKLAVQGPKTVSVVNEIGRVLVAVKGKAAKKPKAVSAKKTKELATESKQLSDRIKELQKQREYEAQKTAEERARRRQEEKENEYIFNYGGSA